MSKPLGSLVFDTSEVRTDEYVLLAKTAIENGSTVDEADLEIRFIDDLLCMNKLRSINNSMRRTATGRIRKNSSFTDIVDARLNTLIADLQALEKSGLTVINQ